MMNLNSVVAGLELLGTSVRKMAIENNIVELKNDAKRSFGINILEPSFEKREDEHYSEMIIDFEIEIEQQIRRQLPLTR